MKTLHPSMSSIWSILHPDLLNIPQLSIPLLLKIGQRCVENDWANGAGKVAALTKVALSWQLSYNKAGQGSPAARQTEESHLSPSLRQVFMSFNTVCHHWRFLPQTPEHIRVRRGEVGVLQKLCSVPSVSWCWRKRLCSISAANGWRGFFWIKKRKKEKCRTTVIVGHLIISAAR